ncbi:MAG: hypothetical protein QM680_03385 [Luteolibacter sp.]
MTLFPLAGCGKCGQLGRMKIRIAAMISSCLMAGSAMASTITVVPVWEPISLHGTDGDEAISEIGDALQAAVVSRSMALTGAFPEVLVDAIRSPHMLPTNHPNYKVQEVNLLVLCKIRLNAEAKDAGLIVKFDVSQMVVPPEVDLTPKQVLNLALIAVRKTLEEYQKHQVQGLNVTLEIDGAEGPLANLKELESKFLMVAGGLSN